MKRPNVIGALIAAGFVFAPGIASSQDDYTLQVEVTNKSKRPVFLGTGYSKTYKEIKLGGSEIYELTLTSSQCKNSKEIELNIANTKYPLDYNNIYASAIYLYQWNNGYCDFTYVGIGSVDDGFEFVGDNKPSASGNTVTFEATFQSK